MTIPTPYRQLAFALSAALAICSCSKGEPTKDQLLSRGNDFYAANQYDKAEEEYRKVIRANPVDPDATRQLALIYFDQGELPQAYTLLRRSAEQQPDNLDIQVKLALTYVWARQFKEARATALAVLDKQPDNEQALWLLADLVGSPKDVEDAKKLIEGYRAKDSDRPGFHLALGQLALRQNDQARAENEFKAALQLDPKSSAAYTALGTLYWSRNDLKQADQALKAAVDLSPPRGTARLIYVDFKRRTGAVAEAKSILEEMSRQIPDSLPPRVYQMKISCEERNPNCAELLKSILTQDPLNYDALFVSGTLSLVKGDGLTAVREFEKLNKIYSQTPQVKYQLAVAYLLADQSGASDRAINSLTDAIRLAPQFDQAILLLAQLKIRSEQYAGAADILVQLINDRPQFAQAHLLLASAYLGQRNPEQALLVYRRMAELFPQNPQASFLIGAMLLGQRKQPEARAAFEKALEISPDYLPATEKLVDLDIAANQYSTAMDRIQKQIDKVPNVAAAWAIRAKIYLVQKDVPHAEADLAKAIELDPQFERAYILLAGLYVSSDRQGQAIEKLNAIIGKKKDDASALILLAQIHERLKNFDAARNEYERVLAINPKSIVALNNLAYVNLAIPGRLDAAYDLARRARALAPDQPSVADTLGWVLFKKAEYRNALPILRDAANKLADEPDVHFHVGMTYYMLGDDDAARAAFEKVIDGKKSSVNIEEARQRLAVLGVDVKTANAGARKQLEDYLRERADDPVALARLAALQQLEGATDEALKTYQKVVDGHPQFTPAIRQLALLYSGHSGDDQKASELLEKARLAYPDDADLAKSLGILNYRRGRYQRSAELLQLAAPKRADDVELFNYLGMAYYNLNQFNEANEPLQRALVARPEDADLVKTVGVLSYRRGSFAKAIELLQSAALKRQADAEIPYYLGMAYYKLSQFNDAKHALERALTMNLPKQLADQARGTLADLNPENQPKK